MTLHTLLSWFDALIDRFEEHSGSIPILVRGSDPIRDIRSVRETGFGRIYWFWYPKEQYSESYWELLSLKHINSSDITCYVSTSTTITERLGIYDCVDEIPELWLLNIESQIFIDK